MNDTSYTAKIHTWLEQHPIVGLPIHMISILFHYVTSFKWVIDLVRWMVTTAGNIAESAFLLATVYVTTNTVAHLLVTWILPAQVIATLNQISTMAFSVLPELIIASAMKTTFDHWKLVWRSPKRVDAWIWACSYTLPTLVFLIMTILTISTFVNFEAVDATPPQATGLMLVTRCLAGWSYGMVQILFVSIGRQGYVEAMDDLAAQVEEQQERLSDRDEMITSLQSAVATLQEQMQGQEQELFKARVALATSKTAWQKKDVLFHKGGREGAKQRSAVHLLKKDEDQTGMSEGNKRALSMDVHGDLESDVNRDLERDQTGISTENQTALNKDAYKDVSSEQTGMSEGNKRALSMDLQSDLDRDLESDQTKHMGGDKRALNRDVNKDLCKDQTESKMAMDRAMQRDLHREPNEDQTGISTGNKTAQKTKADGSEAAKKIQRILRRNPNTGPAELAAKTGVSKRYASHVKSQFLAILAAEQSA